MYTIIIFITNLITIIFEAIIDLIDNIIKFFTSGGELSIVIILCIIVVVLGKFKGEDKY